MRAFGLSPVVEAGLSGPAMVASDPIQDGTEERRISFASMLSKVQKRAPKAAEDWQKFISSHFLLLSFAVAVIFAMSWPALGKWLASGRIADVGILQAINNFIVFFISGLTLKTDDMRNLMSHWVGILYGVLAIQLITPFFGYIMLQVPLTPEEFSVGLAIFCVVPTTLGVGVALTAASKGNQALALLLTVGTNILGIATVPYLLRLIISGSMVLSIDPVNLMVKLVFTVLLPTLVGKALRELTTEVKHFAIKHKAGLSMFSTFQLALIVLQSLSGARNLLLKQPVLGLISVLLISSGTHIVFLGLNALAVSRYGLRLSLREGIAVLIMSSQKSAPVALTVITYITAGIAKQGLLAIPCIVGQIVQIFIGSALTKYLRSIVDREEQE